MLAFEVGQHLNFEREKKNLSKNFCVIIFNKTVTSLSFNLYSIDLFGILFAEQDIKGTFSLLRPLPLRQTYGVTIHSNRLFETIRMNGHTMGLIIK